MRSLLIMCATLVSFSMNFSPAVSQSHFTYGNQTDRLALLEFKGRLMYGIKGAQGLWNDSDHCSWIGVSCNLEHPRRVTVLDLSHSESVLSGRAYIPSDIGNLTFLVALRLSFSGFYGEIPQEIGGLSRLRFLYLNGNNLQGMIPPSLKNLKAIQELVLGHNSFSGPIPEYIQSFHSLQKLDLSWNNFEGEVPIKGIFQNASAFLCAGNNNLCGGTPLLRLPSCPEAPPKESSEPLSRIKLLLIFCGVVFCVTIILGFFAQFLLRRRRARIRPCTSASPPFSNMLQKFSYKLSSSKSDMFHKVSYKELLRATDGFSAKNLVGVGGYGSVYVGILRLSQDLTAAVAVKVLDLQRRGAFKSFKAECEVSRCIRHRNIMKILTCCSGVDFKGNEFKALLYEFMPNGSLEDWLHPTANNRQHWRSTKRPLKLMERINIAIDVASALDYLHRQCQTPIAHCDLKPSNVLLDEDMNGHLGDFGSAKFLPEVIVNVDCSSSFRIRGSIGYVAPECGMGTAVSTIGDYYSFGIMLLELFTGKRPTSNMFKDGLSLHRFAKTALRTNRVIQIVDHTLVLLQNGERKAKFWKALTEIFELGVTCSIESPKERMEMELVVKELQLIKNVYLS